MLKTIIASAAILAATVSVSAMDPERALTGLIRMEIGSQYCNLAADREATKYFVEILIPHVKVSNDEFIYAIQNAAKSMANDMHRDGTLTQYCAELGMVYGRHGR